MNKKEMYYIGLLLYTRKEYLYMIVWSNAIKWCKLYQESLWFFIIVIYNCMGKYIPTFPPSNSISFKIVILSKRLVQLARSMAHVIHMQMKHVTRTKWRRPTNILLRVLHGPNLGTTTCVFKKKCAFYYLL